MKLHEFMTKAKSPNYHAHFNCHVSEVDVLVVVLVTLSSYTINNKHAGSVVVDANGDIMDLEAERALKEIAEAALDPNVITFPPKRDAAA
jgi:hypothetical protein